MRRPSRLLAVLVPLALAVSLSAFVPRAGAIDPFPTGGILTLSSDHFVVHYNGNDADDTCPDAFITQQQAGDVLGMAERAFALYSSWGYGPPVDDGDGHVDISVDQFEAPPPTCISYGAIAPGIPLDAAGGLGRWDALISPVAPAGAADIHLSTETGLSYHIIAHQLFHLEQRAISPSMDQWLGEGTAEWAAVHADGVIGGVENNPDRTTDCVGTWCGDTEFDKNGYPGWLLFEYLAERFGDGTVKDVLTQAASVPNGVTDLSNVLATHGTSLANFFNDYVKARLTASFTYAPLAGLLPKPYATVEFGSSSTASNVAVNHLAVRYLALKHGSGTGPCYEATLSLKVTLPAGLSSATSVPYYYAATKGSTAQALTVSGSTGSITVPWNTCAGSPDALLSLPNATTNLDGREFAVTGTITVDTTKPAAASEPPPGVKVIGPIVSTPTSDPAPTLSVRAPEVLRVSSSKRLLRFLVFSSGDGKLRATLGSLGLGTAALRAGNNDLRFTLPAAVMKTLRVRGTKTASVLSLTSLSTQGAEGATFTRRVSIIKPAPKKPAPKKKHAPKKKSKKH